MTMQYIEIAQLEKQVSVIGLGTASSAFTLNTYDRAAKLIERFLELGGNCIDTANIYGFGDSEKTLGKWIQESGRRDELVLITKDRKSTRLNSSHIQKSRMPSSA